MTTAINKLHILTEGKKHSYSLYGNRTLNGTLCDLQTDSSRLELEDGELYWVPMVERPLPEAGMNVYVTLEDDQSPPLSSVEEAIHWMEKHDVEFTAVFVKN